MEVGPVPATGLSPLLLDLAGPEQYRAWGDFLYATSPVVGGGGVLRRISPTGVVVDIATNLGSEGGVAFRPDGALYFTDMARHSIHRVTRCTPP